MASPASTPGDYEAYVAEVVAGLDDFRNATIYRNREFAGVRQPGRYEVDIALEISLGEALKLLVIIECKQWRRPVDRPVIQKLAQTRDAIAAHKAVIASPVGFTAEAVEVAKAHGIAVWVVAESTFRVAWASPPPGGAGSWHPEVDLYCDLRRSLVRTLLPLGDDPLDEQPHEGRTPLLLADLASREEGSPRFSNWLKDDVEEGNFVLESFHGTFYPRGSGERGVDTVTAEFTLAQWLLALLRDHPRREYSELDVRLRRWRATAREWLLEFGVHGRRVPGAVRAVQAGDPEAFFAQLPT